MRAPCGGDVTPGHVIVLNGVPRSGKSTVASALMDRLHGSWVNVGVDTLQTATPQRLLPGMGLRPGGERRDLEPFVVAAFAAMYAAVRSFSRSGVGVVVDVGHHDNYTQPLDILGRSARQLTGVPVLFVGIRCAADAVVERRRATWGDESVDESLERVRRWEDAVHRPGIYDLEVDTAAIRRELRELDPGRWAQGPGTAFAKAGAVGQR